MSNFNKNGWVSLAQICEERQLVIDAETGKKVLRPAYFSSMNALIEGAFQFARFFEEIHQKGKVYCSISPDVFYFNLKNGAFHFEGEEFLGEAYVQEPDAAEIEFTEFLAPELAEALAEEQEKLLSETEEQEALETFKECYSLETDRYFMAVYLFEYFFHTGSPFEGKKMVNRCFLSPEEKELFRAREGRFCMEPGEEENIPVKGIQDKLIQYWNEYPEILQKMFQKAFLDGGRLRELRPTEVDWKQLLVRMAMDYKSCHCGFHGFSYRLLPKENGTFACPKCGKIYYPLTNGMDRILLAEGEKLYECQTGRNPMDKDTVTGLIVENRQKKGLYGIKNVSQGVWRGFYPDGKIKDIPNGQGIPIWNGMSVRFELGEEWNLRLMQQVEERSRELKRSANEYCEDALRRTEEAVAEAYDEIKKSRARFRALSGVGGAAPAAGPAGGRPMYDAAADED